MNLRVGIGFGGWTRCRRQIRRLACRGLGSTALTWGGWQAGMQGSALAALAGSCHPPDGDGREGNHVEDEVDSAEEVYLRAGRST